MTEEQVINTITKVVNKLASKFKFGYYDSDDIKQEGFIIALEGLEKYDETRPLENFLFVHIKNRLISFKRGNYIRKSYVCVYCNNEDTQCENCRKRKLKLSSKQYLIEPLDISNIDDEFEPNMWDKHDAHNIAEIKEYVGIINQNLAVEYRSDYLKMKAGVYISKSRRDEIENVINKILEEYGYENGQT
jgi:DNA-directed RNA polymerase specialized sigma24 family protein